MRDFESPATEAPEHGGNLDYARRLFGEPADGWQDLSTGISPWGYPVPQVPQAIWHRLPEGSKTLKRAAAGYYQTTVGKILPLPGSQFAIARLPRYLSPARVALPAIGYSEHHKAWASAGHQIFLYQDRQELWSLVEAGKLEHLVLINPNNPSADTYPLEFVEQLCEAMAGRGIVLIDEAFADLYPDLSASPLLQNYANLWLLRSAGKFFGLAGLRLGFLLGSNQNQPLAERLKADIEPWGISHPAQWLGVQALNDTAWQTAQRRRLLRTSKALETLWQDFALRQPAEKTFQVFNGGLFVTLKGDWQILQPLYYKLGEQGIFLRWCHWPENFSSEPAWLRCGQPHDSGERLTKALENIQPSETFSSFNLQSSNY